MKPRIGLFLYLMTLSAITQALGPQFLTEIESQTNFPAVRFTDTTTDEATWVVGSDFFVNEALYIQWADGGSERRPVIIENGAPNDALYIDSDGNVGLGTPSPDADLHITDIFPAIRFEDNHGTPGSWTLVGSNLGFQVNDVTNSNTTPFIIQPSAGQNALVVDFGGNVGLGTGAPTEAVDVVQDGAARFQLSSFSSVASDAAQFIQRRARGNQAAPAPVQSGDNIGLFSFRGMRPNGLFSGSKAAITVQATQNWQNSQNGTSIKFSTTQNGTSTLSTVMEITHDKKVKINGTDLNVPDYVFEDEYDLMPLDELKAFIHQHKHLPDVASAEQVQREGVDLGGSQMALLQKIEELILYTLQQEEHITRQREQNKEQVQRLKNVETRNELLISRLTALERLVLSKRDLSVVN